MKVCAEPADECYLQSRAVNDLVVNGELTPPIVDHHDSYTPSTICKGFIEARPEATLVDDRQALLHVPGFRHGHNSAILSHVKHTIGLEDGAQHILDYDRRGGVRHEAGFLL